MAPAQATMLTIAMIPLRLRHLLPATNEIFTKASDFGTMTSEFCIWCTLGCEPSASIAEDTWSLRVSPFGDPAGPDLGLGITFGDTLRALVAKSIWKESKTIWKESQIGRKYLKRSTILRPIAPNNQLTVILLVGLRQNNHFLLIVRAPWRRKRRRDSILY